MSNSSKKHITITHKSSGELIAEGKVGWDIFPFEGNYYVRDRNLRTKGFTMSYIPGICPYKFIYFWYHLKLECGAEERMIAWKYWLPNPLFPFIAFRIAVPKRHPALIVEEV